MNEVGPANRNRRVEQLEKSLALCERERALIAYEVHDGLLQQLVAASMLVDAATAQLPDDPDEAQAMLHTAAKRLRCAIDEGRRLIRGVRPSGLETGGLCGAIHELVEQLRAEGLDIALTMNLTAPRLAPALENAAFRILQQALNNVQRHSGAQCAEVVVKKVDNSLELIVRDGGRGFDPQKVPSSRFGLQGIRERADLFGGTANIESQPGAGTTILVQLPLDDRLLAPNSHA